MEKCLWKYLKKAEKPIVLYGMGNGADKIINVLNEFQIPFQGVFATDGFVRDKFFHGFKLASYAELKERFGEMIVLLCFGSSRSEVLDNIRRIAAEQELYAPEVPVYGGGLFTDSYFYNNKDRFEKVYSLLADDISCKTFENIINFKLSGKIEYLFNCETGPTEPYLSFIKLQDSESFVDLGAYNGDTAMSFADCVGGKCKITAVEPDFKSYAKLVRNTEKLDIECVNACISDVSGLTEFAMRGGRNSSVGNGAFIRTVTVDELMCGKNVTYIKADVEGEEEKAIKGMKETIIHCKPRLCIACYHRTDDLINIPEKVFEIRKDYKIYMRHFRYVPAWDTNYYFI